MSARSLQQCARCFSTSMRAAQQPIPVPADWQNAPIVTRRQTPAYQPADFSHIADQRARKAFEQTSKAYYLLLGHDPDEVLGRKPSSSVSATSPSSITSPVPSTSSRASPSRASKTVPPEAVPPTPTTYRIPPAEDPLLGFLTNLMMKDGKKATARKHVALTLETLRLRTSQHPLPLLKEAIRKCAPSVRLAQQKKGGKQVSVPIALGERQRVRQAIAWILDASDKRKSPGAGGSKQFGERVAMEFEAILNDTSDVLKRKEQLHTLATVNRANAMVR